MENTIILDRSEDDTEALKKVVRELHSNMQFITFRSLESFASWFESLTKSPPEDNFQVLMMISSRQLLGARHSSLLQKISGFMKQKGYLIEGADRLPLLVTAFSASDDFDRSHYKVPFIDNVIFKPFDAAVCKGKLNWALKKHDAMGSEELAKQKPVSPLEMLKDVQVQRITELGFRSESTRPIEAGKLARYYIPTLKPLGDDYGVYAASTSIEALQDSPIYACSFSFFGLDQDKAKNIRDLISKSQDSEDLMFDEIKPSETLGVIAVADEKDLKQRIESSITASFKNAKAQGFLNFFEFYSELEPVEAAKAWTESFKGTPPLILEYSYPDGGYLRAYHEKDKENMIESYLGLNTENLSRFKTLCLSSLESAELRKKVSEFWTADKKEPLAIRMVQDGDIFFLTIAQSQIVDSEKDRSKVIRIVIRTATDEEVAAMAAEASRIPQNTQLLILGESIFRRRELAFWNELKQKLNPNLPPELLPLIVIGKTKLVLYDQAMELEGVADYLVDPFDQAYLKKKIKYLIPEIQLNNEKAARACANGEETIKVGTQVEVRNFSEVSLSIEYHRPLTPGSFREFVIYIQEEGAYEELTAKVVESEKDGDVFLNHFTIFGHDDVTNQKIRQWLNEQYQLDKQDSE